MKKGTIHNIKCELILIIVIWFLNIPNEGMQMKFEIVNNFSMLQVLLMIELKQCFYLYEIELFEIVNDEKNTFT